MKNTIKPKSMWLILVVTTSLIFFVGCTKVSSSNRASSAPPIDDAQIAMANAAAAEEQKDAKTLNAEAYDLIAKRQFEGAIKKLQRALRMDPKFADAYKNVALAHCDWGHPELGQRAAEEAIALAPESDKAQFVLGKILLKLGRTDDSIRQFQKATQLNSKYDKAYYWLGLAYDRANNISKAQQAFDEALRIKPDEFVYLNRSQALKRYTDARASRTLPALKMYKGLSYEFALDVYSQVFYEALLHNDYDFLERAAGQARSSRERWRGGNWKLQFIYSNLKTPLDPDMAGEAEWLNHLDLLQKWVNEKPESITARIALASGHFRYGWRARGTGTVDTVTPENKGLFAVQLAKAKEILLTAPASEINCPQWYQLMQDIAMPEGWDRQSYDDLYNRAVRFEPGWDAYYGAKAIRLLPRWGGSEEELHQFLQSLLETPDRDGAMHYFLACQALAQYTRQDHLFDRNVSAAKLRDGLKQLQKKYGATAVQLNWAAFTAMRLGDKAFTKELLAQIGNDWYASVWLNEEGFSAAKNWSES